MSKITKPENKKIFETAVASCWRGDDGIVYLLSKNVERTIKNYESLFDLYRQLSENGTKKICLLGDLSKTPPPSHEVRDFISRELPKYIKAMALVSETPVGKVVANIFTKVNDQSYPREIFDNVSEAQNWLKQYLD